MRRLTPEYIESNIKDIMYDIGFKDRPRDFSYISNPKKVRKLALYSLRNTIKNFRDNGGNISEPFSAMIDVCFAVEYREADDSMLRTYYIIKNTLYSHMAAYANSEGYLSEFKKAYNQPINDRTLRIIRNKENKQLEKDTAYLKKKFLVNTIDIKYAIDEYKKYLQSRDTDILLLEE